MAEPLVSVIVEVSIPGQVVEVDVSSSFHQVPDAELEGLIEFWEVDELVQLIKDSQPSQQVLEMLDHPAQNELNFVLSGSSVEAYLRKHRPHLA